MCRGSLSESASSNQWQHVLRMFELKREVPLSPSCRRGHFDELLLVAGLLQVGSDFKSQVMCRAGLHRPKLFWFEIQILVSKEATFYPGSRRAGDRAILTSQQRLRMQGTHAEVNPAKVFGRKQRNQRLFKQLEETTLE